MVVSGVFQKARVFLASLEVSNNFRIYEIRESSRVAKTLLGEGMALSWPWGLIAPFGFVGLVLMSRDPSRRTPLVASWVVGLFAAMLVSFVTARYRLPVSVLLCIPAVVALRHVVGLIRERESMRALRWGLGIVGVAVLIGAASTRQTSLPAPIEWQEAVTRSSMGRREAALAAARTALQRHPNDLAVVFNAARLYEQWGQGPVARELIDRIVRDATLEPDMRFIAMDDLAISLMKVGDFEAARAVALEAVAIGIDRATYEGKPFFRLPGPPTSQCRAELLVALCDWKLGQRARASSRIEDVVRRCGTDGRVGIRLEWIRNEMRR